MKKIKKFRINIREKRVLSLLKYNEQITQDADDVRALVTQEIHAAYEHIFPAAIYETCDLGTIVFLVEKSQALKDLFKKSLCVSLLAVTIGNGIEKQIEEFQAKKELARASIWDAIGSEAVEQAANFVNRLINEEAKLESCFLLPRFSLGYEDTDIKDNTSLLNLLEANKIGVQAAETGILTPQKSITALIGWEQGKKTKQVKK